MINVAKFVKDDNTYDFEGLFKTAYDVTGLMENLINVMAFPDDRFKVQVHKYRPIGVGPAGLSDAMFKLGLRYNGKDGKDFAAEVMRTITHGCVRKSAELAKELGAFFEYADVAEDAERIIEGLITPVGFDDEDVKQTMDLVKQYGVRHVQHTTCQPTGTTAISSDCSYGIEPSFGLVFEKNLMTGKKMKFVNQIFKEKYEKESWYTEDLMDRVLANGGSLKNVRGVPRDVKDVFVVAHDIKPKDRIEVQSAIQRHTSSAISSTVNLPLTATKEEISDLYMYAYEQGLKGVTVYRDGCKKNQPVSFKGSDVMAEFERPPKLLGVVYQIKLDTGNLYVTVSEYQGKPIEVFLEMGNSGQDINGMLEALGKSISKQLQWGVPIQAVIKQYKGIRGETPIWHRFEETDKKPAQLFGIPDAVAKLLERYYVDKKDDDGFTHETCPKCRESSLLMVEGCKTCSSCGWSLCS